MNPGGGFVAQLPTGKTAAILPPSSIYQQSAFSKLVDVEDYPFASESTSGLEQAANFFSEDLKACKDLDDMIATGQRWIYRLYSYRCISRALPSTDNDDTHFQKAFNLLKPKLLELLDLISYCRLVEQRIECVVRNLLASHANAKGKPKGLPKVLSNKLISLLDILFMLDNVKDMRNGQQNDLSTFKRCVGRLRINDMQLDRHVSEIQTFLTDPQSPKGAILFYVKKKSFAPNKLSELVLVELISFALAELDSTRYCFPEERFRLLRFLSCATLLMDGLHEFNAFKHKRVKEVRQWMLKFPVLPLFADLHIQVKFLLGKCTNFNLVENPTEWVADDTPETMEEHKKRYELQTYWPEIRKEFELISTKFALVKSNSLAQDVDFVSLALETVLLVGKWKTLLLLQQAFKFSKGASVGQTSSSSEYDRVVRENYSGLELHLLFDVVCLIKSLASMLARHAVEQFSFPIRRRIHFEVQEFCQLKLPKILHQVSTSKRKQSQQTTMQLLVQLRTVSIDWLGGNVLPDFKNKSVLNGNHRIDVVRAVAPSPNQLLLIRSFVDVLIENATSSQAETNFVMSWLTSHDFDKNTLDLFRDFHHRTYFFPYLLSLESTLESMQNLHGLWFREFYLDMTKQIQFPISSSLPWIVLKQVLDSDNLMIDSVLLFLDVYNDALCFALRELKQLHLVNEVEAEAKLVFEQFIFLWTDHVYSSFKSAQSSQGLPLSFKLKLTQLKKTSSKQKKRFFSLATSSAATANNNLAVVNSTQNLYQVEPKRYNAILSERAFGFLGRVDIDLSRLLCDGLNAYFKADIELLFARFESQGLTSVREFEACLFCLQETHASLLRSNHALVLDDFQDLLHQVDECVSSATGKSRLVRFFASECVGDLMVHWTFNSLTERFLCSKVSGFQRKPKPASGPPNFLFGSVFKEAYQKHFALEHEFVGRIHFDSLLACLAQEKEEALCRLAVVCQLVVDRMQEILVSSLLPMVSERIQAMRANNRSSSMVVTQFFSGSQAFASFDREAKSLFPLNTPERNQLFQSFRELGNGFIVLRLLSQTLNLEGLFPSVTIVRNAIDQLNDTMQKSEWFPTWQSHFYTVFNLVQFSFASTAGGTPTSVPPQEDDDTEFGDGLLWGGYLLLSLLGQRAKFDLLDYSSHVARADALERCWKSNESSMKETPKVYAFLTCVRESIEPTKALVFSLLAPGNAYMVDDDNEEEEDNEKFVPFHPPGVRGGGMVKPNLPPPPPPSQTRVTSRGMPPPPPPPPPPSSSSTTAPKRPSRSASASFPSPSVVVGATPPVVPPRRSRKRTDVQ